MTPSTIILLVMLAVLLVLYVIGYCALDERLRRLERPRTYREKGYMQLPTGNKRPPVPRSLQIDMEQRK